MTRIDFYILPSADPMARLDFACKLSEKAWRLGNRIHLHCRDQAQREALNARLWSFKGESFLPHDQQEADPTCPITLGLDEQQAEGDLLINLAMSVPACFTRFARVAEVVIEEPESRQAARENFRFYRQGGYPLQDHKLPRV